MCSTRFLSPYLLPFQAVVGRLIDHDDVPSTSTSQAPPSKQIPKVTVVAIDNGLAFPFKHPDEWRACKHLIAIITEVEL
ncbi:unnamed protein product [Rodentolepis nana]|uniref:Secreted protein n=1 Tax=Rodentolepis nana TaxID=102285 RepID=A0A0R3TI54_RODNA|nr:unnamed protein product [Rodentolepis nana]